MNRQIRSRLDGERIARMTLIRLLCAISVWRTAVTRILPLCGAATWWTALLCLLPGAVTALLLRIVMHLTRTDTLAEAIRACLGQNGAWLSAVALAVPLLTEGIAGTTALITLFTEGIGTRGTQLTLAILTGVLLLASLHREGLPRASFLLRWGMCAGGLLAAAYLLTDAKPDALFPLYGNGLSSSIAALKQGMSLAWPVTLLLTVEPCTGQGRLRSGIVPVFCAVSALLLLTLSIPHERLILSGGLAESLLLTVRYMPNALRVIIQNLLMLTMFLSIAAAARLAASAVCMPMRKTPEWLPYTIIAVLTLTQAADVSRLWRRLGLIEPWLLAPLLFLAGICLMIALFRRNKA